MLQNIKYFRTLHRYILGRWSIKRFSESTHCKQSNRFMTIWRKIHNHFHVPERTIKSCWMSSGMHLVCESKDSCTVTIGCFLPAGAMYEKLEERGSALFLEHLLFRRTMQRNEEKLLEELGEIGAVLNSLATRDMFLFYGTVPSCGIDKLIEIFADIIINGVICKEDVNAEKCIILNELASMEFDYEKVIMDYLPTIAYHDTELANSVYTESQIVRSFSAETLTSFKNRQFKQCFMTMVGIGAISLQELQWRVCQHFNIGILDECESRSGNHEMFHTLQVPNFRFSGADLRLRDDDEELGYVAVGFEGPSYKQMDDHLALTIAKQIIGSWDMTYGGANHNAPYLAHCAFNSDMCYEYKSFMLSWISTSIWGCYFVCDKLKLEDMIYMLQKEWRRLYTTITDKEVTRAVNQCITQELTTLSNSEAHFLALIDVLFKRGYHEPMNERLARYEKVTANRIREVADKYIYDRCPAVVAIGRIENLPDYNVIRRGMYSLRY